MKTRSETTRLLIAVGLGSLLFLAGLSLARTLVPEWRLGGLPDESFYVQRYRELAGRLGARLASGPPRVSILTPEDISDQTSEILDRERPGSPVFQGVGPRVQVVQEAVLPQEGRARDLAIDFSLEGDPLALQWAARGWRKLSQSLAKPVPAALRQSFAEILLAAGESLGKPRPGSFGGIPVTFYEVRGGAGGHVSTPGTTGDMIVVTRGIGEAKRASTARAHPTLAWFLQKVLPPIFRSIGVALLFLVLVTRRRIDLVNASILAGAVLVVSTVAALVAQQSLEEISMSLLATVALAGWVFLFWSVGESFLRTSDPGFTTSLDSLRAGRIGPRGGRALLHGLALGGALAGFNLGVTALAVAAPGVWPEAPSVRLPVFGVWHHPFVDGLWITAMALLMLGVARRLVAVRWVPWATALIGAVLAPPLQFDPYVFSLAANFFLYALLVFLGRRYGLTALLTAAISSLLLPAAVFSALHLDWLPGTFGVTAGTLAAFLLLGLVGLRRPARVEAERLRPPAFMRRIDEERRIKYEMNLLARMQEGLLPESPPEIPGWQIAARSILATEAGGDLYDFLVDDEGRLWVAAGDVAGHGYSCAIVQAMTTAALTSLIAPEKTPAEILKQVDRVIRRGGSLRNFATLALLRLDTKTGEVLLSNAGHPFPFLSVNGDVTEIPLPGLPLGQGPPRVYRDHVFHLPPGSALVFCSDGLIETCDWSEAPYGFDRPLRGPARGPRRHGSGDARSPPGRLEEVPRPGGASGRHDRGGAEAGRVGGFSWDRGRLARLSGIWGYRRRGGPATVAGSPGGRDARAPRSATHSGHTGRCLRAAAR